MALCRVRIENFKSIKTADFSLQQLNLFIGENGSGKTNILEAIDYFYSNLTTSNIRQDIFDSNNHFSNQVTIRLHFDLSGFVKIAKAQSDPIIIGEEDDTVEDARYGGYYKKIISMASKSPNYIYSIELSQTKHKQIVWNCPFEDRSIIKGLFPLFHLDTRSLDITKWDYLWDVIGELSKVSNSERKLLESSIHSILIDDKREISKKLRDISSIFETANVTIKSATPKDFASTLAKVFFSGQVVQQGGKPLMYYSTGTNSVKYIELLLNAIDEISKSKLKEPVILLDEPEISLHPQLVDELTDSIGDTSEKLCFLISTHSSRLTKNFIINHDGTALFNVRLLDKYSSINRMKLFPQYSPNSTPRVTDDHVNSYFSRAILFVEGETELELFSNPYLHALFPKLHHVDVYKALTDKPVLNIMHPQKNKNAIPYICLIDMDKAVGYKPDTKKFFVRREYIASNPKEAYQFKSKNNAVPFVLHQRLRIEAMANKLHIHYYRPLYSTNDSSHEAFVSAVHDYLLHYHVFAFSTTIEGALVNIHSVNLSTRFLRQRIKADAYTNFTALINQCGKTDKINLLRIVYGGKSDLWQTYSSLQKDLEPQDKAVIDAAFIGKKASGWVTSFIQFFFEDQLQVDSLTPKAFLRIIQDPQQKALLIDSFKHFFPELYDLIQMVEQML